MATLQWDHAVQFVNQPEAAIQTFADQQLRAVAGGRHPGWGTRNALSYFGLTYIEFRHFRPGRTVRRDGQVPAFAGCRAVAAGERSAVSGGAAQRRHRRHS